MSIISALTIVLGLSLFEVVNSVENAVINAEVLKGMNAKSRRWFLLWGMLFAIVVVRGLLPWIIVWISLPSLGPIGALTASFSGSAEVHGAIEAAAPGLLAVGGTFLLFLFLHWLFAEPKGSSKILPAKAGWFYAAAFAVLLALGWYAKRHNPELEPSLLIGSAIFFIIHGFKQGAERRERSLVGSGSVHSDLSKIFYLEIIDTVFSVDGVLGAFAFTLSVPLILLGNGIGALVVRQLTVGNIDRITKYRFLKDGAMYSMLVLGSIMVAESFGSSIPTWLSPIITFLIIGYFLWRSHVALPRLTPSRASH